MKKILKISIFVAFSLVSFISCGNQSKKEYDKIEKLIKKTETLDSLLNQEVDKVLTLDSLIEKEQQKLIKLDSIILKSSSKLDSVVNKVVKTKNK